MTKRSQKNEMPTSFTIRSGLKLGTSGPKGRPTLAVQVAAATAFHLRSGLRIGHDSDQDDGEPKGGSAFAVPAGDRGSSSDHEGFTIRTSLKIGAEEKEETGGPKSGESMAILGGISPDGSRASRPPGHVLAPRD